jgi:hypothetical protein
MVTAASRHAARWPSLTATGVMGQFNAMFPPLQCGQLTHAQTGEDGDKSHAGIGFGHQFEHCVELMAVDKRLSPPLASFLRRI